MNFKDGMQENQNQKKITPYTQDDAYQYWHPDDFITHETDPHARRGDLEPVPSTNRRVHNGAVIYDTIQDDQPDTNIGISDFTGLEIFLILT